MTETSRLATAEDYARAEFEPWDKSVLQNTMTNERWMQYLYILRLSLAVMCRTKAELQQAIREEGGDAFMDFYDNIEGTRKIMEESITILTAAGVRVLAAASAEAEKEDNPN